MCERERDSVFCQHSLVSFGLWVHSTHWAPRLLCVLVACCRERAWLFSPCSFSLVSSFLFRVFNFYFIFKGIFFSSHKNIWGCVWFIFLFSENYFYFQKIKILKTYLVWLLVFCFQEMKTLKIHSLLSHFLLTKNEISEFNQTYFHHYFLFLVKIKTKNNQIEHPVNDLRLKTQTGQRLQRLNK